MVSKQNMNQMKMTFIYYMVIFMFVHSVAAQCRCPTFQQCYSDGITSGCCLNNQVYCKDTRTGQATCWVTQCPSNTTPIPKAVQFAPDVELVGDEETIIPRSVTPENIMSLQQGMVKLVTQAQDTGVISLAVEGPCPVAPPAVCLSDNPRSCSYSGSYDNKGNWIVTVTCSLN